MGTTQIAIEPGTPQMDMTREFDAPVDIVYRAFVEPELLAQWLGPRGMAMTIERCEARDGGRWRFIHTAPDGSEFAFRGVFHGDPSPAGIVQTWEWEGMPGHVALQTAVFEETDSGTLVSMNAVYQTTADRDTHIANGMEQGARESFERLEELLGRLAGVAG